MAAPAAAPPVTHPLALLTAEEVATARQVLAEAGLVAASTRFVYVGLEEPDKADVLGWTPGRDVERRVRVLLLDRATGRARDLSVSLTRRTVVRDLRIDADPEGEVWFPAEDLPVPAGPMQWDAPVGDDVVRWAGWEFRIGFDSREGLSLHQVTHSGRSVLHRASIAGMEYWLNRTESGSPWPPRRQQLIM